MPAISNLFIFGDSITYGEWDEQGGWANRIRSHFDMSVLPHPDDYTLVYNLGIPSDTSTGVLARLENETRSRLINNTENINNHFVIAIGTNDSRWLTGENRRDTEIHTFRSNLEHISRIARRFSNRICFVGLCPCDEPEMLKSAHRHQWVETFDNQALHDYNLAIREHCSNAGLAFVDLFEEFSGINYHDMLADGLHPNDAGHALIFSLVLARILHQSDRDITR